MEYIKYILKFYLFLEFFFFVGQFLRGFNTKIVYEFRSTCSAYLPILPSANSINMLLVNVIHSW